MKIPKKAIEEVVELYESASDSLNEYTNAILEQQQAIKKTCA